MFTNVKNIKERFEAKVIRIPFHTCWEWIGAKNNAGYGNISVPPRGKNALAHRTAYSLYKGPVPKDACVMHLCDNPGCVNPDHLILGTIADNNRDKARKNRSGLNILSPEQVREIRAKYNGKRGHQRILAKAYGTTHKNIHLIVTHQTWRFIE